MRPSITALAMTGVALVGCLGWFAPVAAASLLKELAPLGFLLGGLRIAVGVGGAARDAESWAQVDAPAKQVYYMTMKVVNIYEAKAKLSEYLDLAASGERVVISKRNQPVVELRAVPAVRAEPRPIGKGAGRFSVPPAFFDPLPADLVSLLSGEEGSENREGPQPARVAERPPKYRAGRSGRRSR